MCKKNNCTCTRFENTPRSNPIEDTSLTDVKSTVGQLYKHSFELAKSNHFNCRNTKPSRQKSPSPYELKYFINVDWLQFTVRGQIVSTTATEVPDNVQLTGGIELVYAGTTAGKWYRYKYLAYFKGDQEPFAIIGTVGSTQKQRLHSEIKILNHRLYEEHWARNGLRRLIKALGVEGLHVTRLDISIDSNQNFLEMYKLFDKGVIQGAGRKIKTRCDKNSHGEIELYHWGSKNSDKSAKGYRKGKELERSNKMYIRECWRKTDLIKRSCLGKHIQRFELTLRTKLCKRIFCPHSPEKLGVDIFQLEESAYLAGIVESQLKGWHEFVVPNPNDKNRSRWIRIGQIDFKKIGSRKVCKLPTTVSRSESWRAKHAVMKVLRDMHGRNYLVDTVSDFLRKEVDLSLTESEMKKTRADLRKYLDGYYQKRVPDIVVNDMVSIMTNSFQTRIGAKFDGQIARPLITELAYSMANFHSISDWVSTKLSNKKYMEFKIMNRGLPRSENYYLTMPKAS